VLTVEQAQGVAERYGVGAERIVVVANGVDSREFAPGGPHRPMPSIGSERPLRLLYVGRLTPQKNVPRLVRAIGRLDPVVDAVIVGDGEERARIEREIEIQGRRSVRLVGAQYGPDLLAWYRWADVFVLPSDQEGMPLAVLEAMAAGLPVLATDVAGTRQLVAGVGMLCDPSDEGLAAGIAALAADPERRAEMAQKSRRRAESCSWEAVADRVDEVYRQMVG
jgi:phosphatidylinositol alpha-mannosyltransferase